MTTLAIAVIAAAAALGVSQWRRTSAYPVAIVAGVLVHWLPLPVEAALVRSALLLAATFLVFAVGAEIDRTQIAPFRWQGIAVAALFLAVTAGIAGLLQGILGVDGQTTLYLVLALTSSSTLLVVEVLRRRERVFEPIGRFVTGVVIAQDATVVLALSVVVSAAEGVAAVLRAGVLAAGLAIAAWGLARWGLPAVFVRESRTEEERLLLVLAVLFVFGGACFLAGLPLALGAWLAGASLSRFPVGGMIRSYVGSFSTFFTMLFFVLLGAVVRLPLPAELLAEGVLVATVLLLRPLLLYPIARRAGMTVRSAVEAVALLAHTGEMALVVALVAVDRGDAPASLLAVVALVVVVTMSIVPWLSSDRIVWRLMRLLPLRKRGLSPRTTGAGHVLLIGAGEAGSRIIEYLRDRRIPLVVVEDDPAIVEALDARGIPAIRGDGADRATLQAAGAHAAAAIVSTMRRMADSRRLLALVHGPPVVLRVFSDREAEEIRLLGGIAVVEADLACDELVRWYRERQRPG
ncbi:cation:proton antiporter [Vulgatibacter sp.]|uniref:cation:proton antiporter domain-containing protein n=1 Tax=Vulgatibacter sp. TaxID=1971226 RepID=UPI003567A721